MPKKENLWYQVGYALETVRNRLPASKEPPQGKPARADELSKDVSHKVLDALLTVGAGSILTRAVSLWPARKGPGLFRLFRAFSLW